MHFRVIMRKLSLGIVFAYGTYKHLLRPVGLIIGRPPKNRLHTHTASPRIPDRPSMYMGRALRLKNQLSVPKTVFRGVSSVFEVQCFSARSSVFQCPKPLLNLNKRCESELI